MELYKINKLGLDDYELTYKDKSIRFHSKVGLVNDIQETYKTARVNLIMDLAKKGLTINDLVIEKKVDGKTIYDNSNKDELEKTYIQQEQGIVFNKAIEEMLGISFTDLIIDIGITTNNQAEEFMTELGKVLVGNTAPSGTKEK